MVNVVRDVMTESNFCRVPVRTYCNNTTRRHPSHPNKLSSQHPEHVYDGQRPDDRRTPPVGIVPLSETRLTGSSYPDGDSLPAARHLRDDVDARPHQTRFGRLQYILSRRHLRRSAGSSSQRTQSSSARPHPCPLLRPSRTPTAPSLRRPSATMRCLSRPRRRWTALARASPATRLQRSSMRSTRSSACRFRRRPRRLR